MLKAVKGNKVYKIEETEKRKFLAQGYDICGEDGKVVEHSTKSTVPYAQYAELEEKCRKLEAELAAQKEQNENEADGGEKKNGAKK